MPVYVEGTTTSYGIMGHGYAKGVMWMNGPLRPTIAIGSDVTLRQNSVSPVEAAHSSVATSRKVAKGRGPMRSRLVVVMIPLLPLPSPCVAFTPALKVRVVVTGAGPVGTNATPPVSLLESVRSCSLTADASSSAGPSVAAAATVDPATETAEQRGAAAPASLTKMMNLLAIGMRLACCTAAKLEGGPRRLGRELRRGILAIDVSSSSCCRVARTAGARAHGTPWRTG